MHRQPLEVRMIYVLAALLPPLGLLLNGQPLRLRGICVHEDHMKREDRRHREVVEAIRQHGPPPGYRS